MKNHGRIISLRTMAILVVPLVGALAVSQIVVVSKTGPFGPEWSLADFNPLTPLLITATILFLLFYGFRKHGERIARLIVSGIIFTGTISALVVMRFLFDPVGGPLVIFYLLVAPVSYLGLYWSAKFYMGNLSRSRTAILTVGSTTVIGGLIGAILPAVFTLALLAGLALLDISILETDLVRRALPREDYSSVLSMTTVPMVELGVGIGDLLVYSILASSVLYNYGIYLAATSLISILFGIVLTARISSAHLKVAGLPIPLLLGSIPMMVMLMFS